MILQMADKWFKNWSGLCINFRYINLGHMKLPLLSFLTLGFLFAGCRKEDPVDKYIGNYTGTVVQGTEVYTAKAFISKKDPSAFILTTENLCAGYIPDTTIVFGYDEYGRYSHNSLAGYGVSLTVKFPVKDSLILHAEEYLIGPGRNAYKREWIFRGKKQK